MASSMATFLRIGYILFLLNVTTQMARGQTPAEDGCAPDYLDPIVRDIASPGTSPIPIRTIMMSFREESKIDPANGLPYNAVVPTMAIRGDMEGALGQARSRIENSARARASGLDVGAFNWSSGVSHTRVNMNGSVSVSKWLKMDGFCCNWFKCRKCEWKTRLFERTINFSSWMDRSAQVDRTGVVASTSSSVLALPSTTAPAEGKTRLSLMSGGKTEDDRNTLERIWDFIAGLLEGIDRLFNGNNNLQLEDVLGQQFPSNRGATLDPEALLKGKLEDYAHSRPLRDLQRIAEHKQRDVWQAFNSALFFSSDSSGFSSNGSNVVLDLMYPLDYDRYYFETTKPDRRRPRSREDDIGLKIVILERENFCTIGREQLKEYMDRLRDNFNGTTPPAAVLEIPRRELRSALTSQYGMSGADEYLRSRGLVKRVPGTNLVRADAPSLRDALKTPGTIPASGSILALAAEQGWSSEETRCAMRAARKRSGSRHLVYPFQSFADCLTNDTFGVRQEKAIDAILSLPDAMDRFQVSSTYVSPLSEAAQYRGWYYCYRNMSMCVGKNRIMWDQAASKYDARGGTHKGIDLIDSSSDENISIRSVADGQLVFNNLDPGGWGNALILPFKKDSKDYMAIYAHLPATAKSLDGKKVKSGDSLSLAGCTGNAGDGKGNCNSYCEVLGAKRTDVHLHFEIVEIQADKSKVKVDPTAVIAFPIASNSTQTLYTCKATPAPRVARAR